ncbi:MAG: cyclic pyranopterin monophosphate synthase MoaC, partial [Desulfatitalea sp.]|nr:cyclic pyranopterin monophosphate synthase MoaC [Desulfatitalea sp.]NNJ99515.1 cyclic pyranopterin monophosphate synthase MoaC [Desulfatitalea sp.]
RLACAQARVRMQPETLALIRDNTAGKGNVMEAARIAGVMAAKQTSGLIPMCHPLNLTHVQVDFFPEPAAMRIEARAKVTAHTGVEMEALTAAAVAALTVYDMCKAHDRAMVIADICLLEKRGGKSGIWRREDAP